MGYVVGIDLGTTFTAAAVWRDGSAQIASLGSRGAAIPSVVLLRGDETELTAVPLSLDRIVAHELGHVAGELDDGPSDLNNINRWVNPIMYELGSPYRRLYYSRFLGRYLLEQQNASKKAAALGLSS